MQLGLPFATQFFQLSPFHSSVRLTFVLSSSVHGLPPELVHSPTTFEPVTYGVFQGREQNSFTVTKGQLLTGEELESGRNIWTASGKSHPASRKAQIQSSQFG